MSRQMVVKNLIILSRNCDWKIVKDEFEQFLVAKRTEVHIEPKIDNFFQK